MLFMYAKLSVAAFDRMQTHAKECRKYVKNVDFVRKNIKFIRNAVS